MHKREGIFMICPNEDKLLGYVDRFLDEEETKQIEQHIRSCPSCAQQLEEMESEKTFLEGNLKVARITR